MVEGDSGSVWVGWVFACKPDRPESCLKKFLKVDFNLGKSFLNGQQHCFCLILNSL